MIITINKPIQKSECTCYGDDEMNEICQQCSEYYENGCKYCSSKDAYTDLNGDKVCKECMYKEVIESGYIIHNTDVVLEFLKKYDTEFRDFIFKWNTEK